MAKKQKTEFEQALAELTTLQKAFVYEYPLCNFNGTEAAARAGYKGNRVTLATVASENLRKPKIKAAIDLLLQERAMSANEVLYRLTEQARATHAQYFINKPIKDEEDQVIGFFPAFDYERCIADGNGHLIKSIKYKKGTPPEIEFYDTQAALTMMGKYYALFTDTVKHEDWRDTAIQYIRGGEVSYQALEKEIGADLATELFKAAGVPVQAGTGPK
jgi:hypothetical protein